MRRLILLITLFSIIIPRALVLNTDDALSSRYAHSSSQYTIESQNNIVDNESFRPDIPIFTWDFEDETDLWTNDAGWELTEASYNSETHSYLSPNTAATYNNTWDVISPQVTLPEVGDGEVLRFNFWSTTIYPKIKP